MTTVEESTSRSLQGYVDVGLFQLKAFGRYLLSSWFLLKVLGSELRYFWVGLTQMMAGYKRWAIVDHHKRDLDEMRSVARKTGTQPDLKAVDRYNAEVRRNRNLTMVLLVVAGVITLAMYLIYSDNMMDLMFGKQISVFTAGVFLFAAGLFALCDAIGHRYVAPVEEGEARPVSPLERGMTISTIQNSIREILFFHCKPEIKITFHGHRFLGDFGVEFDVHLTDRVTQEHLTTMEKHMQTGRGRIKLLPNRENTAAPTLRLFWADPLGEPQKPEKVEPKSRSVYDKFKGFRDEMGHRLGMSIVGAHQFWTGRSGSGKSSALWILLDFLVDCRDAEVYGIDIGGTVFGPYRRQMKRVASTIEDADEILDAAIAECERRVALLDAKMDADEDGIDDENWVCSDGKDSKAWFIVIDEYAKFAKNKDLRAKVEEIYQTGRKARIHMVVSTPGADKDTMGSTTPITQAMIKVMFGTPLAMLPSLLGKGAIEEGWRPDLFESAVDGDPGDSGKCYIQSAEFGRPVIQRFDRLTLADIRERNQARRNHSTGAPVVPEALAILKAAFALNGNPDKLPTAKILEIPLAAGWTAESLAAELKELGESTGQVMPAPKKLRIGTDTPRGYEWAGVEVALKAYR